ncbi:MAG TPA: sodium:proton antiporter [Caulobacteraceae bacterium]|nr:sodium:proton antiporter [Caulobacteraceae bacterium]
MSPFDVAAVVVVLAAGLGWANQRFIRLPRTSALTILGAVVSLTVVLVGRALPHADLSRQLQSFLDRLDFHRALMGGMLSFLLFAGALHVDVSQLRRSWAPILALSTVGVLLSTLLIGVGVWLIGRAFGVEAPLAWCLVFGALISPTDPVAVLSVFREGEISPALKATIGGESLFNDGVGVVVFAIVLAFAGGASVATPAAAVSMFLVQAGGGAVFGLVLGLVAYRMMRVVDDYSLEVLITLALVMGGYAAAWRMGISGPVAMAVAGLVVGNHATTHAMSAQTRDYLVKFWRVVDDILNAGLFLMIGLEAVALVGNLRFVVIGLLVIPLALAVRAISVGALVVFWRRLLPLRTTVLVLTWGGLRGGLSVAMALALPPSPAREFLLVATFVVVMASVVIQSPTVAPLLARQCRAAAEAEAMADVA